MLETIKEKVLRERPLLLEEKFNDIFSWAELENILNLRPFVNSSRFSTVGNHPYSWENQAWLSDVNTFPPSLMQKVIQERLCVITDASRISHKVNQICSELESFFVNSAVDSHVYFTCAENLDDSFGIHWDTSHNLIIQIEGQTEFKAWDEWSARNRNVTSLPSEPIINTILNPGDAVFVPKQYYHSAFSKSKRMSISFPINFEQNANSQDRHWIKI